MIKRADNKRAAIYLRCSTDKQDLSTKHQRSEIQRLSQPDGYLIVIEEADEGISGTSMKGRLGLERLMREAMTPQRRFDYILVYDYSRLSRGTPFEAIALIQRLREVGVEVISVTEPMSGNDLDYVMLPLRQLEAHTAVKKTSKNTLLGQARRASEGAWIGGAPPYGYDLIYVSAKGDPYTRIRSLESGERALLKPDGSLDRMLAKKERTVRSNEDRTRLSLGTPERVELVRRMFALYIEGFGYKAIADRLNHERILSPRNGNYSNKAKAGWSRSTIKSILDNPVYTGDSTWNRRTGGKFHRRTGGQAVERPLVERAKVDRNDVADHVTAANAHPAIVDRETFEHVQRLQRNRRTAAPHHTGRSKNSRYLLSGRIHCGHCRHTYIGQTVNKGKRHVDGSPVQTFYYLCGGYAAKGTSTCRKAPLPKEMIETAVLGAIGEQVRTFIEDGGDTLLRRVIKKALAPDPAVDENRKRLERRADEVARRIDELIELISATNKEFIDRKLETLKAERDQLNDQLAELGAQQNRLGSIDALVDEALESIRGLSELLAEGSLEEKKELVALMVEKVDVDPVGRTARVYMRKFPAPSCLGTGNLLQVVAGAGFEPATCGL